MMAETKVTISSEEFARMKQEAKEKVLDLMRDYKVNNPKLYQDIVNLRARQGRKTEI
ncbi:MAG: hypothetical protein IBX70_07655 [Clostridia bacterium]|nr:hypothetical protein [Clostridia bacterium]